MARIFDYKNRSELEQFLNAVSEVVLQQNLSLFLGAGSSIQYNTMSWKELINNIFDKCQDWNNIDRAQYAELSGIKIKEKAANLIQSISIDGDKTDTYLNHLLDFDYESLWTTNYDCIIEHIIGKKTKSYIPIYKYSHFKKLTYPGSHFLFKINGSCDDANTIVITHDDFIDYRKTHEAYLILLKRELLCHSFLFLGCSFEDDILRICVKDILNCIDNNKESYSVNHYAIIVDSNEDKLRYISKDLVTHYNINCLQVSNPQIAHKIAMGISYKVRYTSVFVSGAKSFVRHSPEENIAVELCQLLVSSFIGDENNPFKIISGMGMSIGHFISGTVKKLCSGKNLNRYLQMEPFPFTNKSENDNHRNQMINKAGIFLFIYGDYFNESTNIHHSGMWKEYQIAKKDKNNIIVPLPCGQNSISQYIYNEELKDNTSFSSINRVLMDTFEYKNPTSIFFDELIKKISLTSRKCINEILDEIIT